MKKINILKTITTLSLAMSFVFSSISFAMSPANTKQQLEIFKKSYTKAPNPAKADPKLYPLSGKIEYATITKEFIDQQVADGEFFVGTAENGYKYNTMKRPSDINVVYDKDIGTICLPAKTINEFRYDSFAWTRNDSGDSCSELYLDLAGLNQDELTDKGKEVRKVIVDFLNSWDWENASDREKIDKIMEFTKARVKYPTDEYMENDKTASAGNIYGALINGYAACSGDADTLHLLCRCVGLNCVKARNTAHEWCYVEVDGKWYHIATEIGWENIDEGYTTDEEIKNHPNIGGSWELK